MTAELITAMCEEISDFVHYLAECDAIEPLGDDEYNFWLLTADLMIIQCSEVFSHATR